MSKLKTYHEFKFLWKTLNVGLPDLMNLNQFMFYSGIAFGVAFTILFTIGFKWYIILFSLWLLVGSFILLYPPVKYAILIRQQ